MECCKRRFWSKWYIEVTTVKNGTTAFKHTIALKNVTLKKGNSDFKLGDNYTYGELLTY